MFALTLVVSLASPATMVRAQESGTTTPPPSLSMPDGGCVSLLQMVPGQQGSNPGTGALNTISSTLSGTVTTPTNQALGGAMVLAVDPMKGNVVDCKTTDMTGSYAGLKIEGDTMVVVSPPAGPMAAAMASDTAMVAAVPGEAQTKDFRLAPADIAISFMYKMDENTEIPLNSQFILGCLLNVTTQDAAPYTCGVARNRASLTSQDYYYDMRLSSARVPQGDEDKVGLYAMAMVPTPNGPLQLDRFLSFDNPARPQGVTRLDDIKDLFAVAKVGTAEQSALTLFPGGSGGGDTGDGGGGLANTNCAPGETPFITGTLRSSTGAPGANYVLRLRAFWIDTTVGGSVSSDWIPGWGPYDSEYLVGGDKDGNFSLCRRLPQSNDPQNPDSPTEPQKPGELGDLDGDGIPDSEQPGIGGPSDGYNPGQGTVPINSEVKFMATVSPVMPPGERSEAVTTLAVADTFSSTTYKDCIMIASSTCTLNLATMAPQVQGTVKTPDDRVVPFANLKVYRPSAFSTPEFVTYEYDSFIDATAGDDGWFGLAMNFGSGTVYKVTAGPPWCEGNDCPFNGLLQTDGFFTAGTNTWAGTTSSSTTLGLVAANFRGKLTTPDGKALTGMNLFFRCPDRDDLQCTGAETYTNWSDGSFALRLNDGTYELSISGGSQVQFVPTDFRIVMSNGAVAQVKRTAPGAETDLCGGTAGTCPEVVTLMTAAPNFPIMVRTDTGDPVKAARVSLEKYTGAMGSYPWMQSGFIETGTDVPRWQGDVPGVPGVASLMVEPDQVYRLRLDPPYMGSSDVSSTEVFIKTSSATDGSLVVHRCARWTDDQMGIGVAPCDKGINGDGAPGADDLLATEEDGQGGLRYALRMPTSNFKAILCRPGAGPCSPVTDTWVQIEEWQIDPQNPGGSRWMPNGGSSVNEAGLFSMTFTKSGAYKLVLNQPWNRETQMPDQSLTRTEIHIYVAISESDGSTTVTYASSEGVPGEGSPDVVDGRYVLRYASPSFLGTLVDPTGGSGVNGAYVEVFSRYSDEYCRDCRRYLTGASVDASGNFSLNLPDGVYILRAVPSPSAEGLAAVEREFRQYDCDNDGTSELYTAGSTGCNDPLELTLEGRLVVSLSASNFNGTLYNPMVADRSNPNATVQWAHYYFEVWDDAVKNWRWQNSGGSNTNQKGRFSITFTEIGRYRVTFGAPWHLKADLSDARVVVDVIEGDNPGELVAVADTAASGGTNVIAEDGKGGWNVSLARPNVSGRVQSPDGSMDLGGAHINVQKWYEAGTTMCWNEACWSYASEVGGTMSNYGGGTYSLNLPQGNWRLQVQPPQGNLDYTTADVELLVDANGTVCRVGPTVEVCPDGAGIAPGALDVRLGMPNLTGWVVTESFVPGGDGGPQEGWSGKRSRWSNVRFEKWNDTDQYWQWVNMWAQTNYQGFFSLNMKDDGIYRVNFDPSWQLNDYSYTTKYLAVCNGGAKVAYITQAQAEGWDCFDIPTLESMSPSVSEQIILRGANLKGYVTKGGNAVGDAWISVQSCSTNVWGGENCQWIKGVNTPHPSWDPDNAGRFNLRIDNEGGKPLKYRIEVSPPWNDTDGLVRQKFDVYFDDFVPTTEGIEYCLGAGYQPNEADPDAPGCAEPRGYTDTWTIALSSGNLAGTVITPDAVCTGADAVTGCLGVSGASLGVEKWDRTPWNPEMYGWVWQPLQAFSTGTSPGDHVNNGRFGLNIDAEGLYRITVNPGWNNPNSYSRSDYVVTVGASLDWCVNQGVQTSQLDPLESQPLASPCNPNSKDNVVDSVTGFTARLMGSNLSGVLYDSSANLSESSDRADNEKKVGDTWMNLSKEVTMKSCWGLESEGQCNVWTYWSHVGNANASGASGSRGKFGFSIVEPGNYRLEISPSRSNPNATTAFRQDFTVAERVVSGEGASADGCVTGNTNPTYCLMPAVLGNAVLDGSTYLIKYPSPNFAGTVFDKNGPNPAGVDPVKVGGAHMSVFDSQGYWVGSTGTVWGGSRKGEFALLLNDGTYRVEIYPPWDQLKAGTRRDYQVTVAGGVVSEVQTIRGSAANRTLEPFCDNSVVETACAASLSLSLSGPNVTGYLFYPGAADSAGQAYASSTEGNQTVMPFAWAQAYKCDAGWDAPSLNCNEWAGWFNSEHDGSVQMNLESSGVYRLQFFPNTGLHRSGALQVEVEIVGGAFQRWRYLNDGDEPGTHGFTPDFGRRKPNVVVTVAGVDAARYLQIYSCAEGSTVDTEVTAGTCVSSVAQSRVLTTKVSGVWKATMYLEPGMYKIGVIRRSGDSLTPTDLTDVFEVTAGNSETNLVEVALDLTAAAPPGG